MIQKTQDSLIQNYEKFRLNNASVEFPSISKTSASMIIDIPSDKINDEKWIETNYLKTSNSRERAKTKLSSINAPNLDLLQAPRIYTKEYLQRFQVAYYRQFTALREDMSNYI